MYLSKITGKSYEVEIDPEEDDYTAYGKVVKTLFGTCLIISQDC